MSFGQVVYFRSLGLSFHYSSVCLLHLWTLCCWTVNQLRGIICMSAHERDDGAMCLCVWRDDIKNWHRLTAVFLLQPAVIFLHHIFKTISTRLSILLIIDLIRLHQVKAVWFPLIYILGAHVLHSSFHSCLSFQNLHQSKQSLRFTVYCNMSRPAFLQP